MPKKVIAYYRLEQPINWRRAFLCGMLGAFILMAWIDIFDMIGITPFNLEIYVGALLRDSIEYLPRAWIEGFFFNLLFGGIMGILYGYFFEFIFRRTGSKLGLMMGVVHAFIAAVAILPFFEAVRVQLGLNLYPPHGIGFLGANLGPATPLVLITGHLLFGAAMGLFYGPVREDRIMTRNFEPGEVGLPMDPDVITPIEDPEDATPSLPYHAPGSAFPRWHGLRKREERDKNIKPPSRSA